MTLRHKVRLESLSIGRCFTLPVEPRPPEDGGSDAIRKATPVIEPSEAWKITADAEGGFLAQNARGEEKTFPAATEVVEIPRQGYDRLQERA